MRKVDRLLKEAKLEMRSAKGQRNNHVEKLMKTQEIVIIYNVKRYKIGNNITTVNFAVQNTRDKRKHVE